MPTITIFTTVEAPIEVCFDLSRSIDLHLISTRHTGEQAVTGVTSGLISLGETVTWRARHFGLWLRLTSRITAFNRPTCFVDEMVKGAFQRFRHEHRFEDGYNGTVMIDVFDYTSPLGFVGKLADRLFLKAYMTRLLLARNKVIKAYAESGKYKEILPAESC